jgi:hypothetical protein
MFWIKAKKYEPQINTDEHRFWFRMGSDGWSLSGAGHGLKAHVTGWKPVVREDR